MLVQRSILPLSSEWRCSRRLELPQRLSPAPCHRCLLEYSFGARRIPLRLQVSSSVAKTAVGRTLQLPQLPQVPSSPQLAYPFIDRGSHGLQLIHAEPPVYIAHNFLSAADCEALMSAAHEGALDAIAYNDAVLFDNQRLLPLALVVLGGCIPDLFRLYSEHSNPTMQQLFVAAFHGMSIWAGIAGMLAITIKAAVQQSIRGKVFTGQKWSLAAAPAPAAAATTKFLQNLSGMLRISVSHLELPTLTR